MVAPTIAIALVRCESRVVSASSALSAAETAPAPCRARPSGEAGQRIGGRRDQAARQHQQQAGGDDRLASEAIGGGAEGDLEKGLGEPVDAESEAHHRRIGPPGIPAACTANTGRIRNMPSMREP